MIKNIIFDVGNVLVKWTPESLALMMMHGDERKAKIAAEKVFRSPLWTKVDMGEETLDEIAAQMKKFVDKEDEEIVDYCLNDFAKIVGFNEDVNAWGIEMKKKGYKIYLLTNFGIKYHDCVARMPLRDYIDGIVASYDEKMVKPDLRIYQRLYDKYQLNPSECLFIDDLKENTDAALKTGMGQVITFNGDINQLRNYKF